MAIHYSEEKEIYCESSSQNGVKLRILFVLATFLQTERKTNEMLFFAEMGEFYTY